MRIVSTIGNPKDPSVFSGTPYHFYSAGVNMGFIDGAWEMDLTNHSFDRYLYNISKLVSFNKPGGYQYSSWFKEKIYKHSKDSYFSSEIISFNQHFPDAKTINNSGGKVFYYIDATFRQLLDRYGFREKIGKKTIDRILAEETDNFNRAGKVVAFQNWCRDSIVGEYNIPAEKVHVILPGANIDLPATYSLNKIKKPGLGKEVPFVLGFIGKDWKRKGLPLVIMVKDELKKHGWNVKVKCAGFAPNDLKFDRDVEFAGFINKQTDLNGFCNFVQSCDLGCLFSTAEFSSIAVLEFVRLGIPVCGYIVDGMADLFRPDYSLRFQIDSKINTIAGAIEQLLEQPDTYYSLRDGALKNARYVTWERSIEEWKNILNV